VRMTRVPRTVQACPVSDVPRPALLHQPTPSAKELAQQPALIDGAYGMVCAVVDLAVDADAREAVLELQRERPAGTTRRAADPPVPTGL
jgi:hypothetical protein